MVSYKIPSALTVGLMVAGGGFLLPKEKNTAYPKAALVGLCIGSS